MKKILTFDEIKSLTIGAPIIEKQEDGIHFYKYTKEQIAFYDSLPTSSVIGTRGTTGIHLDFHTDATAVTVKVADGVKYEVYMDGLFYRQFLCDEEKAFTIRLAEGEHRVMIVLPSHKNGGVIEEISLEDATILTRHTYNCKMLFLGDSITQGWNSVYDTLSYAYRTSTFFRAETWNQGLGGSRFFPETAVPLPFDPDYVFVAFGTNDFDKIKRSEDRLPEFKATAEEYLSRIQNLYGKKTVFVISPIPRLIQKEQDAKVFNALCDIINEMAKEKGFVSVNGRDLIPFYPAFYADESLHPNDVGFSIYAENLIQKILPYVK